MRHKWREPEAQVQGAAKRKSWTRIKEKPTELFREARSWLGYKTGRLPPLRAKPVKQSKPSKLWKSLNSLKPSRPPKPSKSSKQSKTSKPSKPWGSLKSLKPSKQSKSSKSSKSSKLLASSPSSSPPGNNNADIQRRIGPIEPDIRETDAAADADAVAGDEDGRVFFNIVFKACSILASIVESQGRTVEDLTGEEVQQAVIDAYFLCTTAPRDNGGGGGIGGISQASNPAPAGSKSQGSNRGRGQSRDRGGGGGRKRGGSEDRGDKEREDGKRQKRKRQPSRPWLCPFYLRDPVRHRQCVRLRLSRINDVRTHIERKHLAPKHCPICGLVFPDDTASTVFNAHVRECRELEDFDYGATPEQWLAIRESGANREAGILLHSDEDEWFAIWDILFEGRAHPRTPHALHPELVQFMWDGLRMYLEQGRPAAIADDALHESSTPADHALFIENINNHIGDFINFMEQLENRANAGQSGPQTQIQMPLPLISAYNSAGSNTGNPHMVLPHSLPSRGPPTLQAWPTFADAGPYAGPAPLQANPHTSVDTDAGPGGADVIDENFSYLARAP